MESNRNIEYHPCGCCSEEKIDEHGVKTVTQYVNPDCKFDSEKVSKRMRGKGDRIYWSYVEDKENLCSKNPFIEGNQ